MISCSHLVRVEKFAGVWFWQKYSYVINYYSVDLERNIGDWHRLESKITSL